jgi:hypothetical protein
VARHFTPGQSQALAAFAKQLERIKQTFTDVDRQDEHFALYGIETPDRSTPSISIDEWGALLSAVKARLRLTVGEVYRPDFNDTPAALQASVLECVDALDQLQVMLGDALSASTPPDWRDSRGGPSIGKRRAAGEAHVSAVPVSTPPLLKRARAALAND